MHYHPGSLLDELHEYVTTDAWVVFLPSSKKTLLYPAAARQVVSVVRTSRNQSVEEPEILRVITRHDIGEIIPEQLLSSLVKAGILLCR